MAALCCLDMEWNNGERSISPLVENEKPVDVVSLDKVRKKNCKFVWGLLLWTKTILMMHLNNFSKHNIYICTQTLWLTVWESRKG